MADVLLHQQSFDYALSRAATETIDWYPSPASNSGAGGPSSAPALSSSSALGEAAANSGDSPRHDTGVATGGTSRGAKAIVSSVWERSAAAALFRQLPTWHLFISSLGSDTLCEAKVGALGPVALRYGIYGSVLANSKGYGPAGGSFWDRIRPVLQMRLSARCTDGSKGVGFRVTFQDVSSIAAVDAMLSLGRSVPSSASASSPPSSSTSVSPDSSATSIYNTATLSRNIISHFTRFDRQLLTNYTIYTVLDRREGEGGNGGAIPSAPPGGQAPLFRRVRLGLGLVLRTKPFGVNIFWGFCVEMLKTLVFLIHIDVLRRTCASIHSSNVFGTGIDAAMRLRINVISFHRTILDVGLAKPFTWRGLGCCWRSSINLGGFSVGGSIDGCSLGEVMLTGGEWLRDAPLPCFVRDRCLAKGRAYLSETPLLRPIGEFSLSSFLLRHGRGETAQSVRVHITGGVNVRHPNLSTYTNPFSASHLYYNTNKKVASSPHGRASGFFDGIRKPSSVHGFFSVTFS